MGVAANGHATALDTVSPLMVYGPYWFNNEGKSVLVARTSGSPAGIVGELRRIVRDVDPEIAVGDAGPLQQAVDASLAGRRYQMWLFVAFGLAALVIAIGGVLVSAVGLLAAAAAARQGLRIDPAAALRDE